MLRNCSTFLTRLSQNIFFSTFQAFLKKYKIQRLVWRQRPPYDCDLILVTNQVWDFRNSVQQFFTEVLSNRKFCANPLGGNRTFQNGVNEFLPCFPYLLSDLAGNST
jgi:hypothetical protein